MIEQTKFHSVFSIEGINFTVITSANGIREIILNLDYGSKKLSESIPVKPDDLNMHGIYSQLLEYFKGERKIFKPPLEIEGTEFQKRVWDELLKIPYGKTITYKELAERLGDVKSIRAAAHANGVNPLPIVIPCHRVIGSDGSLVGYGGGLHIKEKLLVLEGSRHPSLFRL